MIQVFKKHGFILIFALAIGFLAVYPTISAVMAIGDDFKGIYPMLSNDEDQYLAMTREAYDGHYNFGSVYLKEHKSAPYLQQSLAPIIFASTAKIFQISVPKLFAVNDFLLPTAGVLILYALLFAVTASRFASGLFSVLYYVLFLAQFNRPINPQFSFLFLFLGLFLIFKIISGEDTGHKKSRTLNFLLAAVFGIAFYIYPFVWSSIFVVYCLSLSAIAVKNKNPDGFIKNFTAFIIPAGIFSIPYILNLKQAAADINYLDQNLRFGFLSTHWPHAYFNVSLMLIGLTAVYLAGDRLNVRGKIFGYSLAFSGIILNWQNVLTGKAFSFSMHYYWVVALFLMIIFASCAAILRRNYKDGNFSRRNFAVIFLMLISLTGLLYKERAGVMSYLPGSADSADLTRLRNLQTLSPVAEWFEKHSDKDSAVLSFGKDYQWFIPAYTANNNFQSANAGLFLISDDELENRWAIQNFYKKGITAEYVKSHNVEIWANKFIERYQNEKIRNKIMNLVGLGRPDDLIVLIPEEYAAGVLAKVDFYRNQGFEKSLRQYSADYILLDKNDPEYGFLADIFRKNPTLSLTTEIENHLIFQTVK